MPGASAADRRLLMEVEGGNLNGVTRLLGGGANVNGSRFLKLRPLISAARLVWCASEIDLIVQKYQETTVFGPAGTK